MDPLKLEGVTATDKRHTPPMRGKRWVLHPITTMTQAGHEHRQRKLYYPTMAELSTVVGIESLLRRDDIYTACTSAAAQQEVRFVDRSRAIIHPSKAKSDKPLVFVRPHGLVHPHGPTEE